MSDAVDIGANLVGSDVTSPQAGTWMCNVPECKEKRFAQASAVYRHFSHNHRRTVKVFPCKVCDSKHARKGDLYRHLRLNHKWEDTKIEAIKPSLIFTFIESKVFIDPAGLQCEPIDLAKMTGKKRARSEQTKSEVADPPAKKAKEAEKVTEVDDRGLAADEDARRVLLESPVARRKTYPWMRAKKPAASNQQSACAADGRAPATDPQGVLGPAKVCTAKVPTSTDELKKFVLEAKGQQRAWSLLEQEAKAKLRQREKEAAKLQREVQRLRENLQEEQQQRKKLEKEVEERRGASVLDVNQFAQFLQFQNFLGK